MPGRRIVLVVDDQDLTRDVVAAMLDQEDIEVHSAPDGATALEIAAMVRPDVVLLDVMMPGEDGFEVCRALRATAHPPRVVMLTGRSDEHARTIAAAAGAEAYVVKPFSARDLFRIVREERVRGA